MLTLLTPATATAQTGCTRFLGQSVTRSWFPSFEASEGSAGYELYWRSGALLPGWASGEWFSGGTVVSPCGTTPTRVVLDVVMTQTAQTPALLAQAVGQIRARFPGASIVLQPIVGGPNYATCFITAKRGQTAPVFASVQAPAMAQAIAAYVASDPSVQAGPHPQLASCSGYRDQTGHLTAAAAAAVGTQIAASYP